jgi:hypothetical protein
LKDPRPFIWAKLQTRRQIRDGAGTRQDELPAIIAPENLASQNVCRKLGFIFWKQAPVQGDTRNLYTLPVGEPAHRSARPEGTAGGP